MIKKCLNPVWNTINLVTKQVNLFVSRDKRTTNDSTEDRYIPLINTKPNTPTYKIFQLNPIVKIDLNKQTYFTCDNLYYILFYSIRRRI